MNDIVDIGPLAAGGGQHVIIALMLAMAVYVIIVGSGSRKERKKRQEMLANLSKNDRVMTIGGLIGSVVSVSDNEVTLKIDESANVKVTVIRSAIQKVLGEGETPTEVNP